jgi:hypothetical protein
MNSSFFHCFTFVCNKMRSRQKISEDEQTLCPLGSRCHTERANDNITNVLYFLSVGYLIFAAKIHVCGKHVQASIGLEHRIL